jgi:hypothetical protein
MPPNPAANLPELPELADLDLPEQWAFFPHGRFSSTASIQESFLVYLRKTVSDPDAVDDVRFCTECSVPAGSDELNDAGRGARLCESCWYSWTECASCETRFPDSGLFDTLLDECVCARCRDSRYSYCEDCDGWYPDENANDHGHPGKEDDGSCCTSPQKAFTIRNDGGEPLASGTQAPITFPSGVIDNEGLKEIRRYLLAQKDDGQLQYLYGVAYGLDELDSRWQTTAGNFTKRLSLLAYKNYSVKIPPQVLSQVGCIARDHSNPVDVIIDITRYLNQGSAKFANPGSCWWGGYSESRCALKTNGGFGLRAFIDGDVRGRAWVMPLRQRNRQLVPTFNTLTPSAFVTFNGYGTLAGYAAPRIMGHLAGWTYRKIGFSCSPMYVNGGTGYLVAPESLTARYADRDLSLEVPQHSHLFATESAGVS